MTGLASRPAAALIAEDEPILRAGLRARLAALWPELQVVGAAADGAQALALFDLHRPHILFLDVAMPGVDGLEVARRLSGQCHIVFITAYDAHAIAAFEAGAVDYLLKPCDDTRLLLALRRVQARLGSAPVVVEALLEQLARTRTPKTYLRWIKASRGAEVDLILAQDVLYFQAEDKYTTVFTDRREAVIRRAIKDLAEELDPDDFWRIHRSTIVRVEAIESVVKGMAGLSVKLRSRPTRLPVSEAYRSQFRHM